MNLFYVIFILEIHYILCHHKIYFMSYISILCPSKTISLDEYKKLLKNKKKMFDMTFLTPEILSKYRDDDDKIDQKILH